MRLEDDEHFVECPGVQRMVRRVPRDIFKHGTSLELLIQGAVNDMSRDLSLAEMPQAQRMAQFLDTWFRQRKTVLEISTLLHLNRSYVGRTIKPQALMLVAQRFLALLQADDPVAESEGVDDALHLHDQRRLGTSSKTGAATQVQSKSGHRLELSPTTENGQPSGVTEVA